MSTLGVDQTQDGAADAHVGGEKVLMPNRSLTYLKTIAFVLSMMLAGLDPARAQQSTMPVIGFLFAGGVSPWPQR
jgi:hypothetical protein